MTAVPSPTSEVSAVNLDHDGQSHVPDQPEVPLEVRRAVLEHLLVARQEDLARVGEHAAAVDAIRDDHRSRLAKAVGARNLQSLRRGVEADEAARRERIRPPAGPEMDLQEAEKLQKERASQSAALLRDLKVGAKTLRSENERTRRLLEELLPKPPMRDGEPVILIRTEDVPEAIREGTANPWTSFAPPYAGWAWNYYWWADGFGWSGTPFVNPGAGFSGTTNSLSNGNAGDFDYGWGEFNASVGFWYRMPAAGLVEAWIQGQSAAAHHHVSLYDEWGWSDSFAYQYDYLTLKATGATPSGLATSQMSWFFESGHTDGHWDKHYLCNACTYWAHLYSDIAFPAGTWVYVEVGTRTTNSCFANDVSVYSTADFRWFYPKVWVESTGA
jgi:hypothetical protein